MSTHKAEGFVKTLPRSYRDQEGRVRVQYYQGDTPCPTVFFKDKEALVVARYRSVIKDLEFAEAAVALTRQQMPPPEVVYLVSPVEGRQHVPHRDPAILLARGLFISAVITYAKGFTQARGRGLQLDRNTVFSKERDREVHDAIMEMRCRYLAHADDNSYEASNLVVVLSPTEPRRVIDGPFVHATFEQLPDPIVLDAFAGIIGIVHDHCRERERATGERVAKRIATMTADQLYELAHLYGDRAIPSPGRESLNQALNTLRGLPK